MVEVGDKVYWIWGHSVLSGTVVKKSELRNKVWIKRDDVGDIIDVPLCRVKYYGYYPSREEAIRAVLDELDRMLDDALFYCKRVEDYKREIAFWESQLKNDDQKVYKE